MAMDELIGAIKMFAGSYPPVNYMDCDGSSLTIQKNLVLFSVIGTLYGGDGQTTFALPDLRDREADGTPSDFSYDKPRWIICVEGRVPSRG
jgi:microcystin-dependent protein